MESKLNYMVNQDYDLNNLKDYGFYKTQPKENPWWQNPLTIDHTNGLGFYVESLSINKNTREIFVDIEDGFKAEKYLELIDRMIENDVLKEC